MQFERECRRKSGLSITSEDLDENDLGFEVNWPHLTASECPVKCARRDIDDHIEFLPSSSKLDLKKTAFTPSFDVFFKHSEKLISQKILLKSTNMCSPILKEERGSESWREFL